MLVAASKKMARPEGAGCAVKILHLAHFDFSKPFLGIPKVARGKHPRPENFSEASKSRQLLACERRTSVGRISRCAGIAQTTPGSISLLGVILEVPICVGRSVSLFASSTAQSITP